MKMFRKILCTALVAMLLVVTMMPAMAATKTLPTSTYYMSSTNGGTFGAYVDVENVKKDSKITAVKSSKTSVLTVERLDRTTTDRYTYADKKTEKRYGAEFYVRLLKVGSANLTFKVDGKAYKKPFAVKKYVNPIGSLKIPGIKDGRELKGEYKTGSYASGKLGKATAAGKKITVKAASGWKLMYAYWEDYDSGSEYQFNNWNKGVSSANLYIGAMKTGKSYYVGLEFENTKTGGTRWCNFSIQG